MKRLFLVFALVIAVASLGGITMAQEQPVCNVTPPETATVIDMIGWSFPITDFYANELRACNAVDNIRVNTQLLTSADAREQVRLALSGGGESPFEIIHADDAFIVELASQGWIMPLDDLIAQYADEYDLYDIPAQLYASATYNGQIYGIPFTANTMHLFYRMDLLEQYDIAVPETYDDVIAACNTLRDAEEIELPFTMNLHAGWAWRVEFHNFLGSFGGTWLNEDNTPAFNSEAGVAAVTKMLEVVEACMGSEGLTYSIDDSEIGMEQGDLAMMNIWASRAANMDNPDLSNYVGLIGFAPAPRANPEGRHAGPAAADFYVIPATTPVDPDLIFRVIMEAVDVESQTRAAQLGIITRASVAASGVGGRYLAAAAQTIAEGAGGYGPNPAVAVARVAIENNLPRVISEGLSPQEALDAAAEAYITEARNRGFLD
jgi:ABC-type glycerol-3-phosphate transport system substrate-binding protein